MKRKPKEERRYPPYPPGAKHEKRPLGWMAEAMANPLEWLKELKRKKK